MCNQFVFHCCDGFNENVWTFILYMIFDVMQLMNALLWICVCSENRVSFLYFTPSDWIISRYYCGIESFLNHYWWVTIKCDFGALFKHHQWELMRCRHRLKLIRIKATSEHSHIWCTIVTLTLPKGGVHCHQWFSENHIHKNREVTWFYKN